MTTAETRGAYSSRPYSPAAVVKALSGERTYLSPADRHEVIRRMIWCEWPTKNIARYLGINVRTVSRVAKKMAAANGWASG